MNNVRRRTGCLLALAAGLATLHVFGQAPSEERLRQACAALQLSPQSAPDLQVLLETSRLATNSPTLRSRAMASYSLALLMRGNTNAFEQGVRFQRASYPDDKGLVEVSRDAYLAVCRDCAGSGEKTTLCPSCMGTGKCKACAGSGKAPSGPCPACKRAGVCPMCSGKQKIETPCPACNGSGRIFQLSSRVAANYQSLLSNIVALCDEELSFAEQYRLAQRENETDARIQKLRALLASHPRQANASDARALLATAEKARDEKLAVQRKREEAERSERELADLRTLADAPDTAQAIAKLKAYLAAHATSPHRAELESLLNELTARQERRQLIKRVALGLLALTGAALLIQIVRPLLFRRRGPHATVADIDRTQFTDPLTLTAKESKARVKTKTANIEPPK